MTTAELVERMMHLVHSLRGAGFDDIRKIQEALRPIEVELMQRRYATVTGRADE